MKITLIILLLATLSGFASEVDEYYKKINDDYIMAISNEDKKLEEAQAERDTRIRKYNEKYMRGLKAIMKRYSQEAKLKQALAVRDTIAKLEASLAADSSPVPVKTIPSPPVATPTPPQPAPPVVKPPIRVAPSPGGKTWTVVVRTGGDHGKKINGASFSPDGKRIVTANGDVAMVWDAASGQLLQTLSGHGRGGQGGMVSDAVFSPDGKHIVTGCSDGGLRIWNPENGKLIRLIQDVAWIYSVAFSPDSTKVLSGCAGTNTARAWDVATGRELFVMNGHTEKILSIGYSPDSRQILTGCGDLTVKTWDAKTGKEIWSMKYSSPVLCSTFDPSGKYIALSSWKTGAALYTRSGQKVFAMTKHRGPVSSIAFSPDGRYLVTGSRDKTAIVWDAKSGRDLGMLAGHTAGVFSAVFSPDGKRILTGSWDGSAIIWEQK